MAYTARYLAGFVISAVLLTAGFLAGLSGVIEPLLADPTPVHAFFFERSPIQWCTLGAFFFVLTVLLDRMVRHVGIRASLRQLERGRRPGRGSVAASRLDCLACARDEGGPAAAASVASKLADEDLDLVARTYGLLHNAVQLMLAFGFLGTVWGISRSLFGSFNVISGEDVGQLRMGLQAFTGAMGTALDTSVLGLVCGLVSMIAMTAVEWSETTALGSLDRTVRSALGLEHVASEAAAHTARVETACADMEANLGREMRTAMLNAAARAADVYAAKLSEVLSHQLGEHLATELKRADTHADQLREALVVQLQAIGRGLQRVPEVSIRYPSTNGGAKTLSQ